MGLSQQLYASSFATWLVIKYFCGLKGSKGVFLSPGCFLSYLWRRKQLKCVFISGCYDFWVFRTQRNPLILPLSIVCVIVVLTACDSVIPYFLAPPHLPPWVGIPTCQLFPHNFNRGGFAYTFISAPQEFPSSLTFSVTLKIFPQTSFLGSNLLSAVAATLSSLPPFPPSLPLSLYSFSTSPSPSAKKAPVPSTSRRCTSPSSVYKGSS